MQVTRQCEALLEVVNRVNGFAGLRTGQQGIAMRRAALQLVQLLSRLGRLMADVLTPVDCTALASTLMEVGVPKLFRCLPAKPVQSIALDLFSLTEMHSLRRTWIRAL